MALRNRGPMEDGNDIREAAALIAAHFGVDEADVVGPPAGDLVESVTAFLARQLLVLLRGDLGKLTQALYRMDVNEHRADQAFAAGSLEEVAVSLAELILVRQLLTVALRRQLEDPDPEDG